MRGPRLAVALGVVLLLLGFATGTAVRSASVDGVSIPCAPALDLTRVPFTESGARVTSPTRSRSADVRRDEVACRSVTLPLQRVTWAALATGGLLVLAGWTVARERGTVDLAGPPRRSV